MSHFPQPKLSSLGVKISMAGVLALLYIGTSLSGSSIHAQPASPPVGTQNLFPYPQCTWWANERYHQLHRIYVPWTTQSNAWQWTARARQFGWVVSRWPRPGDIIDLQPRVQGASGLGHVALVERILSNGHVLASNLNWGAHRKRVTYVQFTPGSGVTFIRWWTKR